MASLHCELCHIIACDGLFNYSHDFFLPGAAASLWICMHFTLKIHFCLSNDISCGNPQYLNLNIHAIKCSKEMWDDDQLNCICTRYMLQIRMNKVLKWKKYVRKDESWNVLVGFLRLRRIFYVLTVRHAKSVYLDNTCSDIVLIENLRLGWIKLKLVKIEFQW